MTLGRFPTLSRFGLFGGRRRSSVSNTVTLPQHLLNAPPVLLEGFEDHTTWTLVNGTKANDAANKTQGTNGLKLTTPATPFIAEVRKTLGTPVTPTTDVMWLDIFFHGDYGSRTITVSEYTTSARTRGRLYNLVVQQPGIGYTRIPIRRSNPSSTTGGSTATDQIGQIEIRASGGAESREFTLDNWQHSVDAVPVMVFCMHDNTSSQYDTAFPLLTARKQRATLATSTGGGNTPGSVGRMAWSQIQEMHGAGHVSTNHTREHDAWQAVTVEADRIADMQNGYDDLLANGIPSTTARIFTYAGAFVWNASGLSAYRNSGLVDLGFGHNQLTQAPYPADIQNVGLSRVVGSGTTLATMQADIDACALNMGLLVYVIHDIGSAGEDITAANFEAVLDRCISQQVTMISAKDLLDLQSGPIEIPAQW